MIDDELKRLEQKVNDLVALCDALKTDNEKLRKTQAGLAEEHGRMRERNLAVKQRIDSLIGRLKSVDGG